MWLECTSSHCDGVRLGRCALQADASRTVAAAQQLPQLLQLETLLLLQQQLQVSPSTSACCQQNTGLPDKHGVFCICAFDT